MKIGWPCGRIVDRRLFVKSRIAIHMVLTLMAFFPLGCQTEKPWGDSLSAFGPPQPAKTQAERTSLIEKMRQLKLGASEDQVISTLGVPTRHSGFQGKRYDDPIYDLLYYYFSEYDPPNWKVTDQEVTFWFDSRRCLVLVAPSNVPEVASLGGSDYGVAQPAKTAAERDALVKQINALTLGETLSDVIGKLGAPTRRINAAPKGEMSNDMYFGEVLDYMFGAYTPRDTVDRGDMVVLSFDRQKRLIEVRSSVPQVQSRRATNLSLGAKR